MTGGPCPRWRPHGVEVVGEGMADGQLPMVAGATGVPRGCARLRWNEDSEGMLVAVAPPPDGRQSLAGCGTEWQSSRVSDAAKLGDAIKRAMHARRVSGSPGARRA
jgi:hypothetical protein